MENVLVFIINVIVNFLDCGMYYFASHNLVMRKPKISAKIILVGVLYGCFVGIIANIFDGYAARIIITTVLLLLLKSVLKIKIQYVLIIFAFVYLCMTPIQMLFLLVLSNFKLSQNNTLLLIQILTTIIIIGIYENIPLHKLYNKIVKEVMLKLLIFSLVGIILSVYFALNFKYNATYIAYYSFLILITLIGLYLTLKRIFFYTNKVPMQLHDIKNLLMGIYLTAYSTTDTDTIRNEIDRVLEIIDIDIKISDINENDFNQNILSFINQKKYNYMKTEANFVPNISYNESNQKVSFSVIIYMLGVLLDNAMETGTEKAIAVQVSVIEESLYISVANEYQKKSAVDLSKMFEEKYSTKGKEHSRGYGLSNLSKVVTDYGGEIFLKEEYNQVLKCNYIKIVIEIKN